MARPSVLELVQLCLVLISIPVYLWFLFTIIRFRKKKPFDSSFFTLCLALGVCDIECLLSNWVLGKFPTFGWFKLDELVLKHNTKVAKIHACLNTHGNLQQFTGVALVAFNRCTAVAFFQKHKKIWSKTFVHRVLAFQFLAPVVALVPAILMPDAFEYMINNRTGLIGGLRFRNMELQASQPSFCHFEYSKRRISVTMATGIDVAEGHWQYEVSPFVGRNLLQANHFLQFPYAIGIFCYLWLVNIFCAIMYGLSFWRGKLVNTVVRPANSDVRRVSTHKREIRLSVIGLTLSSLMTIYGILIYQSAMADPEWWETLMKAWGVVNDVFSWSNPWLCFTLAPTIRKHMIAVIKGKANTLQVAPRHQN